MQPVALRSAQYSHYIIIMLAKPPELYAMGFSGGCGTASYCVYFCVPVESMRICASIVSTAELPMELIRLTNAPLFPAWST
jgi:hypothetical protein